MNNILAFCNITFLNSRLLLDISSTVYIYGPFAICVKKEQIKFLCWG